MDHLRTHAEAFEAELNQAVSLGVRTHALQPPPLIQQCRLHLENAEVVGQRLHRALTYSLLTLRRRPSWPQPMMAAWY